ncbi:MAG: histidine phosphatase family protein [Spirochaetota bacterium]
MQEFHPPPIQRADAAFFGSLAHETRFIIVRHGQSEGNARSIVQGRLDLPLDATGRAQAAALAPWIQALQPDLILSSHLARAHETACILGGGDPPRVLDSLAELEVGPFQGLSFGEARRLHPEAYAGFLRQSWDGVPGAEHSSSLYTRALQAWAAMREAALGGARVIIAVSHGGLIQWLIKSTMGVGSWLPLFPMSNCGASEYLVTPRPEGLPPLVQWKRIDYLAPGLGLGTPPIF